MAQVKLNMTYGATGTLPAVSGANLTNLTSGNLTGALPAISGASLTGISAGITEADQWRLTTDFTNASNGANEIITANWERNDTHFDKIGTGLTESSGVFSFPSTGIWLIQAQTYITLSSATSSAHMTILTTPDNSTYTGRAFTQVGADANRGDACMCQCFIDVTNTTNDKFKIQTNGGTYITWNGHSSQNETTVTAFKLGAT